MHCLPSAWQHRFAISFVISRSQNLARKSVPPWRACKLPFAVVDLELIGIPELKQLCAQFPSTAFVCIHRLADDRMWSEALAAGAVDCCCSSDMHGILLASERYVVLTRTRAGSSVSILGAGVARTPALPLPQSDPHRGQQQSLLTA